jgi:16S rRNA (guanine1516-N2)-methyltransferase
MAGLKEVPDVIYLDPMFPSRQKSALVKKKFQMLHKLEQPCEEGCKFLEAALDCKPRKIVIKRPIKGEFLGDRKPDYSISGKTIRYDCIVIPR